MIERLRGLEQNEILRLMEFIEIPGGVVQMGTDHALRCTLEGRRWNETPVRQLVEHLATIPLAE